MAKPSFILSKGERKALEGEIDTSSLDEHYRRIFRGLFAFDGLPEDCPAGFPMDCLYETGGLGIKKLRGIGPVLTGITPSTLTVYGQPYQWVPQPVGFATDLSDDFFQPTSDPCLYLGGSISASIQPYLQMQAKALKCLNQNVIALSQPIAFKGLPGVELPAIVMKSALMGGDVTIPTTGAGFNVEVLDLKAQDHSQNLVSLIDWCDSRILEIMMSSNGVEKSSGITTLETVSGVQSILQEADNLIRRIEDWMDKANTRFGLSMRVRPGRGLRSLLEPSRSEEAVTDEQIQ